LFLDIQTNLKSFRRSYDFILKNKKLQEEIISNHALRDKDYDLVSTIYQAAQRENICRQYMEDAEKVGDNDAAQFFNEVQEQNQQMVRKGKEMLKKRL